MFLQLDAELQEGKVPSDLLNINNPCEAYAQMLPIWKKNRDVRNGSDAVKGSGEEYLARLDSMRVITTGDPLQSGGGTTNATQANEDYKHYKDRAIFFNATGQTVNSFVGMLYKKNPTITFDKEFPEFQQSAIYNEATPNDENFISMLKRITDEILTTNRCGVLEDFPAVSVEGMSQLQFEQNGYHSYSAIYPAESIINWGYDTVNGHKRLSFIVLAETWEDYTNTTNKLKPQVRNMWRLAYLEKLENGTLEYRHVLIRETAQGRILDSWYAPEIKGKKLDYIPFWCLSSYGHKVDELYYPVINDLVEVNLGHYRNSADYENELHKLSIKTAVFPGWNSESYGNPQLGGAIACPPDQKPFILEASSQSSLATEMTAKEQRMAVLGSQILSQRSRYAQASQTAEINSSAESSIIGSLAQTIEQAAGEILTLKLEWAGMPDNAVSVKINRDYYIQSALETQVPALLQAVQAGYMSLPTFYYNMDRLGAYPADWSIEKERSEINNSFGNVNDITSEITLIKQKMEEQDKAKQKTDTTDETEENNGDID